MNPEDGKCQNHSADAYYIHSAFRQSVYRVLHSVNLTRQPSSGASGALLAPQQFFGGRRKEGEGASPRLHPGFGTTTTWNSANNNPLGNRLQYVQYSLQLGISIMTQEIAELVKDLYTSHFTLPVPTQIPLILHDPYPPNNTRKEGRSMNYWITCWINAFTCTMVQVELTWQVTRVVIILYWSFFCGPVDYST